MKRTVIYLMAGLAMAACTKETPETPIIDNAPETGRVMTLTATLEDQTKAGVGSDGKFSWSAGDEIAVEFLDEDNNSTFLTFKTENGDGTFTHTMTTQEESLKLGTRAFSPASLKNKSGLDADCIYLGDSYGDGLVPLVAAVSDETLSFKYLFAMMEVTFENIPSSISPKFRTYSDANWGEYKIEGSADNPTLTQKNVHTTNIYLTGTMTDNGTMTVRFPVFPGINNRVQVALCDDSYTTVAFKQASIRQYNRKTLYRMPSIALGSLIKITNNAYTEMQAAEKSWDTFNQGELTIKTKLWNTNGLQSGKWCYVQVNENEEITICSNQGNYPRYTRTLSSVSAPGTLTEYSFSFGEGLKKAGEHFFYAVDQDGGEDASIYGWDTNGNALYGSWSNEMIPVATTTMWENGRTIRMFDMTNLHGYIFLKTKYAANGCELTGDVFVNDDDTSRGWIAWGYWHNNGSSGCYQRSDWNTYIKEDVWK